MNKFKIDPNKKYVFIMGAGASKDDNIPVQDEILKNILKSEFAFKNKEGLLANAPSKEDGMFKIPKFLN